MIRDVRGEAVKQFFWRVSKITWDMDEPFVRAKSSSEDCDYKFKVKIVEAEEIRELGISTSLRKNTK